MYGIEKYNLENLENLEAGSVDNVRIEAYEKEKISLDKFKEMAKIGVTTHKFDDADNVVCSYLVEKILGYKPEIKRVDAGNTLPGLNFDCDHPDKNDAIDYQLTGILNEEDKIVFDHTEGGSAAKTLYEYAVANGWLQKSDMLEKMVDFATKSDNAQIKSSFAESWRTLAGLARGIWAKENRNEILEKIFSQEIDEESLLTDEQIKELGLEEISAKQKEIIENTYEALRNGREFIHGGKKGIAVEGFVPGGSQAAYEGVPQEDGTLKEYEIYLSYDPQRKSAAFASKDTDLSEIFVDLAKEEPYAGWYLHPSKKMVTIGSAKGEVRQTNLNLEKLIAIAENKTDAEKLEEIRNEIRRVEDEEKTGDVRLKIYNGPLWGWVNLGELAEAIGQSPEKTWRNFFGLTKDIQYDVLAWTPDLKEVIQDGSEPENFKDAYVPAGWAFDVLEAVKHGAVRIETVDHEHLSSLDGCPPGTIACYFNGVGFSAAVGINEKGEPIDYCVNPSPRMEDACCQGCLSAGEIQDGHSLCGFPSEEGLKALADGRARIIYDSIHGVKLVYDD